MGSDFSALDAELDQVGAGPEVDAVSLANQYAGDLPVVRAPGQELAAIDSALAELGAEVQAASARERGDAQAPSPERTDAQAPTKASERHDAHAPASTREPSEAQAEPPAPTPARADPESQEIALPDQVVQDTADRSQELPLDPAPRSGSFALDEEASAETASAQHMSQARTPERGERPSYKEEDDFEEVDEFAAPRASARRLDALPPETQLSGVARTHSVLPPRAEYDDDSDAAFAALFGEVTKQSSIPSPNEPVEARAGARERNDALEARASARDDALEARASARDDALEARAGAELLDDDTEIFDSAAFARATQDGREAHADEVDVNVEELDSAEFEVLTETAVAHPSPSSTPPRPSRPPEKRPSFLGRLFGRKEE